MKIPRRVQFHRSRASRNRLKVKTGMKTGLKLRVKGKIPHVRESRWCIKARRLPRMTERERNAREFNTDASRQLCKLRLFSFLSLNMFFLFTNYCF